MVINIKIGDSPALSILQDTCKVYARLYPDLAEDFSDFMITACVACHFRGVASVIDIVLLAEGHLGIVVVHDTVSFFTARREGSWLVQLVPLGSSLVQASRYTWDQDAFNLFKAFNNPSSLDQVYEVIGVFKDVFKFVER